MTAIYEYERSNYADGPLTAVWPDQISARRFINAIEDPSDPSNYHTIEKAYTIPPHGRIETWFDPIDNPILDDSFDIWTGPGKTGTQFTKVTGTGVLGAYDARIYPMQPTWIDFNTARSGETVYVTVKSSYSRITSASLERLYVEMNAMGASFASIEGMNAVAAEDILADMFVRLSRESGVFKIYKASASSANTLAMGYAPDDIQTGETGWVQFFGKVVTVGDRRVPPDCTRLYLSPTAGYYTWIGDTDPSYMLESGVSQVQYVGMYLMNGLGYINCITNPSMGVAP